MSKKKFWQLKNSVDHSGSTLILEGPISQESWWGDEVTPQEFRDELKKVTDKKLTVSINSVGGDVWAGVSIYNALAELDAEVTVKVDGLAASIASVIAMAGDKIIMSPGSTMMIHRASMLAMGDADDMKKAIEMLETVEEGIIQIYSDRTGQTPEAVKGMMDAETWMSPDKAVELGFADQVGSKKESEDDQPQSIFNGNFAFSMSATKDALNSYLGKVADSEKDEEDAGKPTPDEEVVAPEHSDATPEGEEALPKTDTEEVVEPTVPEVNNSTDKKEDMNKQEEIAKDQVIKPENQAPVVQKPSVKSYLKTNAAMEAFANILQEQAGKTSDDVKNAWKEHLELTMGVVNPEVFLPDTLITEIEDAFRAGGEIWNRVAKTGADVFRAAWDIQDDSDDEDGRARGYNREDQEDKAEQVLELNSRVLRPQFVYKYITLNKEDVKNSRSTGALVRYVLSELPRRIVREVERAIVIGDGRADGSDYKITSFVAITADAAANNAFAVSYTPAEGESNYESVLRARDEIEAEGPVVLICRKGYMTDMMLERNDSGGLVFAPGTDLARVLRLEAVVEPDWFTNQTDYDAVLAVLSGYKTVGDNTIESFTNFTLKQNKQEYLQELWAGGGLTFRRSAVAIEAVTS